MKAKKKNQSNWGNNNNNNNNKKGKNNKNNQFCVLVGNYPPLISPEAVVQALTGQVRRITGNEPNIQNGEVYQTFEFSLFFPNQTQMDSLLKLNGSYIYNNPIWIIKYPFYYQKYAFDFSEIFSSSACNGQIDLSNLRLKFEELGKDPSDIDFNNKDFVEFFLYRLGSESRDKRFYIDSLILNNNFIEDINRWSPYLVFLPTVHSIVLNQNPLKEPPNLPAFPYIIIKCDSSFQQNNKGKKKNNQNNWNQDQNGWNQNQNQNGWNQNQNQNGWNQNQNQNGWNQNQNQNGWNQNQNGWNQNQSGWNQNQNQNQGGWNQNQNQNGWNQGQDGWNQDQNGWNQDQNGWNQDQNGWNQDQNGWNQDQNDWNQGQNGWNQDQNGW